ncbi:MAG: molybdopterin-dependent oxidoreductase [Candidatus Aminicenantes bacterium]|jgi:anaerobic selenocysteine-containing dehydrogenase
MKRKGISRRKFMKSGLAWVAGTAAGFGSIGKVQTNDKITAVSRTSLKSLRAIPTTCEQCPAGCGIMAYLDGDRLVQILGNPNHPNNRGGICAKGIAGINLVNDTERLLHPLKRKGTRGSGAWTQISWDEAYSTLSDRIRDMMAENRISEFVIDKGQDDSLFDRFLASLGTPRIIDRNVLKNLNRRAAFSSMLDFPALIEDVGNSRTVLNFGANPFSNHDLFIGFARRLVHARMEKGTKLITFDVRLSETAAKCDSWYPIKAGTDGIVALALAKTIVDKGLADSDFIENKTNFTLSNLKSLLSPYSLQSAERESGVNASDIERLAIEFATQKPSVAIFGGGITDHENGTQNAMCVSLLNWLVGNLEKEGGLFFPRFPGRQLDKERQSQPILSNPGNTIRGVQELEQTHARIDTYFVYLSNPAYSEPDCQSAARLLKDDKAVPLLVVMDTHLTETAMLADVVLPAATYLEGWGLNSAPSLEGIPILNIRQPVVSLLSPARALRSPAFDVGKLLEPSFQPMGEAVEIGNMCLELARRIGRNVSNKLPFQDTQDYVSKEIPGYGIHGGLESLKKNGFWVNHSSKKNSHPEKNKRSNSLKIPKIKIQSRILKQEGSTPLLHYQAISSHKHKKDDEFILTTFKPNLMGRGTANSKWVREMLHENCLWINKGVAGQLRIKNGDRIRVISKKGSLTTKALTTSRIHPESVALAEGLGHTAVGNVARSRRFKSKDRDTSLIWWDQKGNGVNPMGIIETHHDPNGGGLGLKDTVVRIEKI